MGNEFKTVAFSVTGALLFIEVHRGKQGSKNSKYQKDLGATAACTKQMMEATKGIGQKSIKWGTNDCFLFDSWFSFKKAAEAAMEMGAGLIGMAKKNTKGFCKKTIEKLTKDRPGGSYLVTGAFLPLRSEDVV